VKLVVSNEVIQMVVHCAFQCIATLVVIEWASTVWQNHGSCAISVPESTMKYTGLVYHQQRYCGAVVVPWYCLTLLSTRCFGNIFMFSC